MKKFADNSVTYACISDENKLSLYVEGENSVKELCSVGKNANLCGVTSDGQKIIWSEEKDNELAVYMIKNGIPERIGKFGKKQKYSLIPSVVFFDRGFVVTCWGYGTLIFAKNDEIIEIPLEGALDSYGLLDSNGNIIGNDICDTEYFYFTAMKNKDSNVSRLYKLDMNGNIVELASDLSSQYFIRANKLFYVDKDKDFYVADIEEKGITNSTCITTEITGLNVSNDGSIAYIVKAQALYYWNTDDNAHQLHQICNNFENDSEIYLTENADIIFYITNMQEIADWYGMMGTLFYYQKGDNKPQEIASNIYKIKKNDSKDYSSVNPIIVQYSKKNSNDRNLYNIGRLNGNQMEVVIQDTVSY